MTDLAPKQLEFILNSTKQWNLAHGSVRSGKTICTLFRFMQAAYECPDSEIWMVGHSSDTIYQNGVRLLFENPEFAVFKPFCTWHPGKRELKFMDKTIGTLGAKDEGAIGAFQGKTFSLCYCDEMTLYPESIINMIDTRLSKDHSMGFATMNPSHPNHPIKKWIDMAEEGDSHYYALHFNLDDNPYVNAEYKKRIKNSLSGVFYKRNYLGLWCMAEGAVFDFFDRDLYVTEDPPCAAEYWVAGIDVGSVNPFACCLVGVSTGKYTQGGKTMWVEDEYYWDPRKTGRQKTNSEFADDIQRFLEPYDVKQLYIDPSAAAMKVELKRRGIVCVDANNDVAYGINVMTSEMKKGSLFITEKCQHLIKEIEGYVWDDRQALRGKDAPLKKDDHCFVADTAILTPEGYKPIQCLNIGEDVITRSGKQPIEKIHVNESEVIDLKILGKSFVCTLGHPFATHRGWVESSHLLHSDILFVNLGEACPKSYDLTESYIDVIPNLKTLLTENITEHPTLTASKDMDIYIETFGNVFMETFHKDTIFITKTTIPGTIALATSNALALQNTLKCTKAVLQWIKNKKEKRIWINRENLQRFGIKVKKDANGTHETREIFLKRENTKNINALYAENLINQKKEGTPNFVQITVKVDGEEIYTLMMNKENAIFAPTPIQLTNTPDPSFAVKSAPKRKEKVYNLQVKNVPEYFAEGILVHNCTDALRYVMASHRISSYDPVKERRLARQYQEHKYLITR